MTTVLVTGGTGLVGKALVQKLASKNYAVIVLTRNLKNNVSKENITYALWNLKEGYIDIEAVKKADAIIHLAGAGVMEKKWDEAYKKEIVESRTKSSELLINALKNNPHKVKSFLSASAIGWYGDDKINTHFFTEDEIFSDGFLGNTCKQWEESVEAAIELGIRVCKIRIGIVLSNDGGAYKEFKSSLKFGIAAILGSGNQMISWIHIDDLCNQFIFALENEKMQGNYNAVSTSPVTNKTLILQLANTVRGKFFIPIHVPVFVLKMMMGERSIEILKSTTVSNEKIKAAGFTFLYPTLEAAINEIES